MAKRVLSQLACGIERRPHGAQESRRQAHARPGPPLLLHDRARVGRWGNPGRRVIAGVPASTFRQGRNLKPGFRVGSRQRTRVDVLSNEFLIKALTDSCRTRRGKDFVRRLAFHQISFSDWFIEPVMHDVMGAIRHGAMTDGIPDDVEPIIWQGLQSIVQEFRKGKLSQAQLVQTLVTFVGYTNAFGWASLYPKLDAEMLPTMAFVMGYRYRTLNLPKGARMFYQIVIDRAPAGSPLRAHAAKSLEQLDAGGTKK